MSPSSTTTSTPPSSGDAPASGSAPVIEVEHATKSFDERDVVDDVTLAVQPGEVFGLMGPSGCGKTTLVRMLVGLSVPSGGTVRVLGGDPTESSPQQRGKIGYVPQAFFLYPTLTVWGNALFTAGLYGLGWRHRRRRAREVLQFLELWDARKRLGREVSGGMQRRLLLACALMHEPELLIVDEPTAGLDPLIRVKIWEHLHALRDRGVSIFLTTQHLDEAEHCDRIAIMNVGRTVAIGTPSELRRQAIRYDTVVVLADQPFEREHVAALWTLPEAQRVQWAAPREVRVLVEDAAEATPAITSMLHDRGAALTSVSTQPPSFDEVFIELVER